MRDRLRKIIEEFGADSGTLHWMGEDGHLHLDSAHGIPEAVLNIVRVVPVGKGMAGLAAERGEPVTVCNIQTDTSGDVRPGAKATGLEGAIALPIFDGARLAGVLGVANRAERTFTGEEIERLLDRGRQLASERRAQRELDLPGRLPREDPPE
jgi:GAF domain-containing protein